MRSFHALVTCLALAGCHADQPQRSISRIKIVLSGNVATVSVDIDSINNSNISNLVTLDGASHKSVHLSMNKFDELNNRLDPYFQKSQPFLRLTNEPNFIDKDGNRKATRFEDCIAYIEWSGNGAHRYFKLDFDADDLHNARYKNQYIDIEEILDEYHLIPDPPIISDRSIHQSSFIITHVSKS